MFLHLLFQPHWALLHPLGPIGPYWPYWALLGSIGPTGPLGPYWPSWALLAIKTGASCFLGSTWGRLGASWRHLEPSWNLWGLSWGPLGLPWASLGPLLGASWVVLGASWGPLEVYWRPLGALGDQDGAPRFLNPTGGRLGSHVGLIFGTSSGDVPSFSHLIFRCPHVKKPEES